jgi:hypothetical protein
VALDTRWSSRRRRAAPTGTLDPDYAESVLAQEAFDNLRRQKPIS